MDVESPLFGIWCASGAPARKWIISRVEHEDKDYLDKSRQVMADLFLPMLTGCFSSMYLWLEPCMDMNVVVLSQ